ncbi:hypothetical protein AXXA_22565 [Achromobacter insuavis AXX-A]|uniref:Uncharacterized protein n=1 Tax=Achromobacter insuavis AXX-A TaxID=1003200 RepID=F7T6D1_9BURK|nr:hypothetical protein AXXA_22565 [Achromobacter insuavis AXX-A]
MGHQQVDLSLFTGDQLHQIGRLPLKSNPLGIQFPQLQLFCAQQFRCANLTIEIQPEQLQKFELPRCKQIIRILDAQFLRSDIGFGLNYFKFRHAPRLYECFIDVQQLPRSCQRILCDSHLLLRSQQFPIGQHDLCHRLRYGRLQRQTIALLHQPRHTHRRSRHLSTAPP